MVARGNGMRCLAALVALGVAPSAGRAADTPAPAPADVRWLSVAAHGGLAWFGRSDGLVVLEPPIAPAGPREVGRLRLGASVWAVAFAGTTAYLAAGTHGLLVVDVADPAAPTVIAGWDTPGSVRDVVPAGPYVFVADHRHGLRVLDVSQPDRPIQRASVPTRGEVHALALFGTRLATAEGAAGARVFDVERPAHPDERLRLDDSAGAVDVEFLDERILVVAEPHGLSVYELDAARGARRVGGLATEHAVREVRAAGSRSVTVACGPDGLLVVALDDPAAPRVTAVARLPRSIGVERHAIEDGRAWIAADGGGLGLVDVSDPATPVVQLPRARATSVRFR